MGIAISLYFLGSVIVYLDLNQGLVTEKEKIYLPLLLVIAAALFGPFVLLISIFDFKKGYLIRQAVILSYKFIAIKSIFRG